MGVETPTGGGYGFYALVDTYVAYAVDRELDFEMGFNLVYAGGFTKLQ